LRIRRTDLLNVWRIDVIAALILGTIALFLLWGVTHPGAFCDA